MLPLSRAEGQRWLAHLHTKTHVPPTETSLRSSQRNDRPDTPFAEVWPQFARALAPTGAGFRTRLTQLSSSPVCQKKCRHVTYAFGHRIILLCG